MERKSTSTWLYVVNKICIYTLKYRVYICVLLQSIPCVNLNTRTFLCWKTVLTYLVLNLYEYLTNLVLHLKSDISYPCTEKRRLFMGSILSPLQFMVNSQGRSMTNRIMETFKENKSELLKDKSVTWTELYIFINKSQSSNKWYWRRWSWWRWGCKVGGHDDKSHFNNYSR